METEIITINGETIELTRIGCPMFHEDWHKAEELGLVYVRYCHEGPDVQDDEMVFCKAEDKEKVEKWYKENSW